jgi:DNA-binding LacI/PurR family transcriptional regulator
LIPCALGADAGRQEIMKKARKSAKVTLVDVARELNISTAAASRALNDLPGVSDALRLSVKETASRLGYAKYLKATIVNAYERSMKFIAVLYGHVGGNIIQGVQAGIGETIRRRGYSELRYMVDPGGEFRTEKAREVFLDRLAAERGVVGIVAFYLPVSDVLIERLYQRNVPIVLVENRTEYGRCVTINQVKASFKAVQHFARTGRRHIACVIPPEQGDHTWQDRVNGYRQALKEARLRYDPSLIAYTDWVAVRPGYATTMELVKRRPDVDAILYASDTLAAGGLKALREAGKRVPEDVAVMGFDDEEFGIALEPELSSIRQPLAKMAETGLHLLFDSIEKGDFAHRAIELETEVIVRASC